MSHLMSVAALVLEGRGDEAEGIAALRHDAPEDCADGISAEEIEQRFGSRVRDLVVACTNTPAGFAAGRKPEWRVRKRPPILPIVGGAAPCRVSLAGKVHNARSILRDHRVEGEAVWDRFKATWEQTLWYYCGLAGAYRGRSERVSDR